jgi:hypothetical protein
MTMGLPSEFLPDFNLDGYIGGKPKEGVCGLYEETAIQYYPIGTRFRMHGREWVYCRAAEAITLPHRGSPNLVDYPWIATSLYSLKGIQTNDRQVAVAGAKKIVVESDDYAHDTTPYAPTVKNFFAGGYAMIYYSSALIGQLRITGSDPCILDTTTATSEDITLYFDDALPTAVGTSIQVDVYPSPYIACGNSNSGTVYSSFVCVPMIAVTADYFFWGQVKGPCWVTPNAGITTANYRDLAFHTNGTVKVQAAGLQRAGYIIYKGDGSQDDAVIMLDI